jgi:periplasmic divalent cation tolerance protein
MTIKNDHNNYGVVLVTASSFGEAEAIATGLIEAKLAPCINLIPITSIYLWEGKLCKDGEYQLIIKTDLDKFSQLERKIKELHSYDVPEIIALPVVEGSKSYLSWISQTLD